MGQAKNRGSLEERVKNAKKFRKEAILSELKKIVEGHYQHVPDQFSHRQNYLDGCVIAMDIKEAMDIVLDDGDIGIIEDGCPKPEYILKPQTKPSKLFKTLKIIPISVSSFTFMAFPL